MKPMSKGNMILLIVIGILLLVIAFGIGWLVVAGNQANQTDSQEELPKYDLEKSVLYPIGGEAVVSNLNTGSTKDKRIIRVKAQLRVADTKFSEKIQPANAEIIDVVITILRKKTPEEIIKPEAKEIVKQEMITALNKHFNTDKILDVYFEEFIVQ